jgi:hypothetical protein
VPYGQASQFGANDVPILLSMLNDKKEEAHWPNIVVTLCMIGDDKAAAPVIAFIDEDVSGKLSPSHYAAKSSAVMALGYLVNKTGNREALDYLKKSLKSDAWTERTTVWLAPHQASAAERDLDLSSMAILGLALSGRPEAAEALRSLQEPAESPAAVRFQAQTSSLVGEALKEHAKVAKDGLGDYYKKAKGPG